MLFSLPNFIMAILHNRMLGLWASLIFFGLDYNFLTHVNNPDDYSKTRDWWERMAVPVPFCFWAWLMLQGFFIDLYCWNETIYPGFKTAFNNNQNRDLFNFPEKVFEWSPDSTHRAVPLYQINHTSATCVDEPLWPNGYETYWKINSIEIYTKRHTQEKYNWHRVFEIDQADNYTKKNDKKMCRDCMKGEWKNISMYEMNRTILNFKSHYTFNSPILGFVDDFWYMIERVRDDPMYGPVYNSILEDNSSVPSGSSFFKNTTDNPKRWVVKTQAGQRFGFNDYGANCQRVEDFYMHLCKGDPTHGEVGECVYFGSNITVWDEYDFLDKLF